MKQYAVILKDQIYHEGDQRSKDYPGHGYPAYTESIETLKKFKDFEEFRVWVEDQEKYTSGRKEYTAIEYEIITISKRIIIGITK